eukprot:371276-Hanusia_phi.AAC.1
MAPPVARNLARDSGELLAVKVQVPSDSEAFRFKPGASQSLRGSRPRPSERRRVGLVVTSRPLRQLVGPGWAGGRRQPLNRA